MRKIISVFLAVALFFTLCACGADEKETASANKNSSLVQSQSSELPETDLSEPTESEGDESEADDSDQSSSSKSSKDKASSKSSKKSSQGSSKPSKKPSSSSSSKNQSSSKPKSSSSASSAQSSSNKTESKPVSKVETVSYKITFKNTVNGYINHYNAGSYGFKTDLSGFTSCDDFYLALTAGTTISCEKDFAFFCYDENFILNTDIMADSGLSLNFLKPEIKSGSYTLSHDCYVRFSVKGKLSDIKIAIPKGHEALVTAGTRTEIELMPTIKLMSENLDGRNNAVNYIFITDIHHGKGLTSNRAVAMTKQIELAVAMANTIDSIDFICIGGDTTTGMYETKEEAIKYTTEILEPLKKSSKPVFVLMGNHDDNSYHRFTYDVYYPERIISDKDWNDNILKVFCPDDIKKDSKYKDSKYYYYDLKGKKTRVICLDAVDYRAEYDKNGVIKELPIKDAAATTHVAKYWSGCSWWGYSDEQIKWLMTEALTAGNDWNYIFMSHMGIDAQTNCYNYQTLNGAELRKVLSSFQNKTSCRIGSTTADFSKTKGTILAYQFGHMHEELIMKSDDIDLWQICTATASASSTSTNKDLSASSISNKTLDWKMLDRVVDTESETCFDLMSVDGAKIQKWNFGAGNDANVNQ